MSAQTGWTPASRPGIVPLHPLSFGTILGRSFSALRQNPRVLLGFALVVQTLSYLVTIVAVGAVAWWAFSRLDTVPYGSDDWDTLFAGSALIVFLVGLLLGLPALAVVIVVQGVVVAEVSAEVVAEKLTLGEVWRRVRPAVWRLLGWAALAGVAVAVLVGVVVGIIVVIGIVVPVLAVLLGILIGLAAIPLWYWVSTKLVLVPSVLILEQATIREAIRRSWHLVRGRFWVAFGTVFLISAIFGVIAQAVSFPLSFGASLVTSIFAPTGDTETSAIIGLVFVTVGVQIVVLLVQSVGTIVQSTATALIYVDCRMRHEGLDLDLQSYVERRDAGSTALPDPYREHIGREAPPRIDTRYPGYAAYTYPGGYPAAGRPAGAGPADPYAGGGFRPVAYPPAGYGAPAAYPPYAPGYPPAAWPAAATPEAPAPGYPPAPAYPPAATSAPGSPAPTSAAPAVPPRPAAPAATAWTAPGAAPAGEERESPWR